jgi:hypothetical protein
MRKYVNGYLLPILIIIPFLILSCKQKPVNTIQISSQSNMDSFHIKAVYLFPDYDNISDLLKLIRNLNVGFIPDAINDLENIDKYSGNDNLTAANIGVYMTDIAYAWVFNETDVAMNCNMAALTLADQLNLANLFLDSFFQKFEQENMDPDTILLLLERDLNEVIRQFPDEQRLELYSALLTGTFIEKLHLIYEMIQYCPQVSLSPELIPENLQKLFWIANGQVLALDELIKKINSFEIPEESQLVRDELSNLNQMLHKSVLMSDTSIAFTPEMISHQDFISLYQEVNKVRGLIVNP